MFLPDFPVVQCWRVGYLELYVPPLQVLPDLLQSPLLVLRNLKINLHFSLFFGKLTYRGLIRIRVPRCGELYLY